MENSLKEICRAGLVAVLCTFVALRVIAQPLIMAAPEPGLIALCQNGQIVYVAWDTGAPVDAAPQPDPCPYFGVSAVIDGVEISLEAPWRAFDRPTTIAVVMLVHVAPTPAANLPRAPPLSA